MLVDDALVRASLTELGSMARWVRGQVRSSRGGIALLGGWAVHAYNPWFGSQDIDFIATRPWRNRLLQELRAEFPANTLFAVELSRLTAAHSSAR